MPETWNPRRFAVAWAGLFLLAPALYGALALVQPYVADKASRLLLD